MRRKISCAAGLALAVFLSVSARATPILGAVATESGVPIAGQEDIVVFNLTGTQGCSTAAGTPICTAVTFDNVVLTVNGTDTVNLGDIAPGMTESYTFSNGIFADGFVTSLDFSATLSTASLTDDLSNSYNVNPNVLLSSLPVDGSFGYIEATLAEPAVPEPDNLPLVALFALACTLFGVAHQRNRSRSRG